MKSKLIYASVVALTLGAGRAHALVDVAVSYDSLGLDSARYLANDNQQRAGAENVALNQGDLAPPPDGQSIGGFLRAAASASRHGDMDTNSWLATGGYASSTARWYESVQNTGDTARGYSLALALSNMELVLGGWSGDYSTRDFRAGFEVDVSVNGASVWHAGRSLFESAAGVRAESHGQALGDESLQIAPSAGGFSSYRFGNYNTTVDLGTLAGGAGFNVVYTLRSFTYWDDPYGCSYECGWVGASVADPLALSAGPVSGVAAVPEPETYGMLLAGLGLLGLVRLRRARG